MNPRYKLHSHVVVDKKFTPHTLPKCQCPKADEVRIEHWSASFVNCLRCGGFVRMNYLTDRANVQALIKSLDKAWHDRMSLAHPLVPNAIGFFLIVGATLGVILYHMLGG